MSLCLSSKPLSHLVIVGVGLLGSSLGLAAKKCHLADTVIGIENCPQTREIALRRGAVDQVIADPGGLSDIEFSDINDALAIICTPVRTIVDYADRMAVVHGNILLSDVGSTKGALCDELEQRGCRFIGAHPIAGSEKSGPEFGDGNLFQDRLTILTPTASSLPHDVKRLRTFWESLGAYTICLEPRRHDEILAKTSHLPHALAAALASLVEPAEHPFCGTGFADTTRIAAGSPAVWTDIFLENRQPLLAVLEELGDRLETLKTALRTEDTVAVTRFLETAQSKTTEVSGAVRDGGKFTEPVA